MKVHEIMTTRPRCVAPENTLVEAAGLMRELDVGALPVCELDKLAGIVTDRDIVVRGVAAGRDLYATTVRDVMSPGVTAVFADQEVEEAARTMEQKQIRRLPVLARDRRLVGIVSLGDMAVSSNPAFSGIALKEVSEPASSNAERAASRAQRAHMMRRAPGTMRELPPMIQNGDGAAESGTRDPAPPARRGHRGKTRRRTATTRKSSSRGSRQASSRGKGRTRSSAAAKKSGGGGRAGSRRKASARSK